MTHFAVVETGIHTTYVPINCESDRLHGLEVMFRGSKVLTVYGVYMPYNNNTPNQTELYMDPLHQLSLMIEETSGPTPFCVVGDMNAELPVKATMQHNWYKQTVQSSHLSVIENVTSTILHTPKEPSQAI